MIDPIVWKNEKLILLDQTRLPLEEVFLKIDSLDKIEKAIRILSIRGAPNLGVAAYYGVYIGIKDFMGDYASLGEEIERVCNSIAKTRPTAHDLFAALELAQKNYLQASNVDSAKKSILDGAHQLKRELQEKSSKIGKFGAEIVPENAGILTHCNTGKLAAPGEGTAFSVIVQAHRQGKLRMAYADESRPLLQGARLTMWELQQRNIPCKLNVDSASGFLMSEGKIDFIVTGADRIARNGDSANKIGTFNLAVIAKYHKIPFYIAAPKNTFDESIATGDRIVIEMRANEEITHFGALRTAPENIETINPAFDVTPHELITGIITEDGVIDPNR